MYLSLAGVDADNRLFLDVFVFPLMWMIWLGGLLVFVGGMLPIAVRRRRPEVPSPTPVVEAGA